MDGHHGRRHSKSKLDATTAMETSHSKRRAGGHRNSKGCVEVVETTMDGDPKKCNSVKVSIEILREQIMGMRTKLTQDTTSTIGEGISMMNKRLEENNEECENRLKEVRQKHKRETERKVIEYESTIHRLREALKEESRKVDELRGRLEECRTSKFETLSEMTEVKQHYGERIKELEGYITEGREELQLLQTERERYVSDKSQVKELEKALEYSEEQKKELQGKLEKLEAEMEVKLYAIHQLEHANGQLESNLDVLAREKNSMSEKLEKCYEVREEKSNTESVRKLLEEQLSKLQTEFSETKQRLSEETVQRKKLEEEVKELKDRNKKEEDAYIRRFASLNSNITDLEKKNHELRWSIREMEKAKGVNETAMEGFKAEIEALKTRIVSKEEEISRAKAISEEIKSEKHLLEEEKQKLKANVDSFTTKTESLTKIIEKNNELINENVEELGRKDRQIKSLEDHVALLKKTTQVLDSQLVRFDSLMDSKFDELEKAKSMVDLLNKENQEIREELRKCRVELNETKSLNVYTEQCLQKAQCASVDESAAKDSEIASYMKQLDLANCRNESLSEQVTSLTNQLTALESEKFDLKKIVETGKSEKERYTRETHALLKTVVDVKDANVNLEAELEQMQEENKAYRYDLKMQGAKLLELEETLKYKELLFETTSKQQNKLIDHLNEQLHTLQEKIDKKKNKMNIFTPNRKEPTPMLLGTPRTNRRVMETLPKASALKGPQTPLSNKPYYGKNDFPTPNRCGSLEEEEWEVRKLEEAKENLKSQLQNLKKNGTPVVRKTQTLPAPKKEECLLLKDTTNTMSGGYLTERTGKPHRLYETRCVDSMMKCKACMEPLYKGRPVAKCDECNFEYHLACTKNASNTCGLSGGMVSRPRDDFDGQSLDSRDSVSDDGDEEEFTRGWIVVATENMTAPEKQFLKIEGCNLNIYLSETCQTLLESYKLNEYTTIDFRIELKEQERYRSTLQDKYKFALKINFYSGESEMSYIFMFFNDKVQQRIWTRAITKHSKINFMSGDVSFPAEQVQSHNEINLLGRVMLQDSQSHRIYVNCIAVIPNPQRYIFGCDDGLYSLKEMGGTPVKIQGPSSVYNIEILEPQGLAVFIEGTSREISTADLRLFKSCARAAECSDPKLATEIVPKTRDCYNLCSRGTTYRDTYTAAASGNKVLICRIAENTGKNLCLIREIYVKESVTSLFLTPYSILFANSDIFEADLRTFQVEEFLDISEDKIYLLKNLYENLGNYPVAILDVTECSEKGKECDPEYLICFQDIGIFVDSFGRPTRDGDLLWTQVPVFVEYRHPHLFIFHSTNIEIKKLDKDSCRKITQVNPKGSNKGNDRIVESRIRTPISRFYPLKSKAVPKFVGEGDQGVVFVLNETSVSKVVQLDAH